MEAKNAARKNANADGDFAEILGCGREDLPEDLANIFQESDDEDQDAQE